MFSDEPKDDEYSRRQLQPSIVDQNEDLMDSREESSSMSALKLSRIIILVSLLMFSCYFSYSVATARTIRMTEEKEMKNQALTAEFR